MEGNLTKIAIRILRQGELAALSTPTSLIGSFLCQWELAVLSTPTSLICSFQCSTTDWTLSNRKIVQSLASCWSTKGLTDVLPRLKLVASIFPEDSSSLRLPNGARNSKNLLRIGSVACFIPSSNDRSATSLMERIHSLESPTQVLSQSKLKCVLRTKLCLSTDFDLVFQKLQKSVCFQNQ